MVTFKKVFFLVLSILFVLLVGLSIASFVYMTIDSYNSGNPSNTIFEMIYMIIHIVIVGFFAIVAFKAFLSEKSQIIEPMIYNGKNYRTVWSYVIPTVILLLGILMIVLPSLTLFAKVLTTKTFPDALLIDIFNVGLNLAVISLALLVYKKTY